MCSLIVLNSNSQESVHLSLECVQCAPCIAHTLWSGLKQKKLHACVLVFEVVYTVILIVHNNCCKTYQDLRLLVGYYQYHRIHSELCCNSWLQLTFEENVFILTVVCNSSNILFFFYYILFGLQWPSVYPALLLIFTSMACSGGRFDLRNI